MLHLLALSLFLAPAGVSAGLALAWVWLIATLWTRQRLPAPPVVWLALVFALYCLAQAAFPPVDLDDPARRWDAAWSLAQIIAFVPVAYALRGDQRLVLRLLLLCLVSLLLGMLWRTDWMLLLNALAAFTDTRPGFGFPTLAYALFAGSALLGLLILRRRCWYDAAGRRRWWALSLWVLAVAVIAEGVILSQARGSWLSLMLVAAVALLGGYWRQRRHGRPFSRLGIGAAFGSVLLLIGLNAGGIGDRLNEERLVAERLLQGEPMPGQNTSLTLRWHALRFGLQQWQARPWRGYGPGASRLLMRQSGDTRLLCPEPDGSVLKHLHNSYLELMVQLGLLGLLLWLAVVALIVRGLGVSAQRGQLSHDLAWFLGLALLYLGLWSLFNFRMVNQDFRGFWSLLAGMALSFSLYQERARSAARARP